MPKIAKGLRFLALTAFVFTLFTGVSHAYIGPGLGLGAIGAALGVLFTLFLAAFAVIWYPIKKWFQGRRQSAAEPSAAESKSNPH